MQLLGLRTEKHLLKPSKYLKIKPSNISTPDKKGKKNTARK
jgi:hypothetical protein